MPVCAVCDSDTFDVVNGLYFCRLCSTQSQEIIEEEAEYAHSDTGSLRLVHGKKAKKSKYKTDPGKPWFTVEGFQVILKAQVDALIKLGCDPKLSEIVKQIWLKYVHISGLACIDPRYPQQKQDIKSFRDDYLAGLLGDFPEEDEKLPSIKHAVMKLRLSSKRKKALKTKLSTNEESDWVNALDHDETGTSTNPGLEDEEWFSLESNFETSDSETELEPATKKRYKRPDKKVQKNKGTTSKARVGRAHTKFLNHKKLVAILFISLQWCRELITLGDLINLLKQGYLPFLDSVKHLLPHMKLGDMDMNNFHVPYIPSYTETTCISQKLADFISMPPLPDVNIMNLVTRYVVQLNLPYALVSFIKALVTDFNYQRKKIYTFQHYVPDLVAFGLVIIALKLLYGLDDDQEWNMDESSSPCKHDASLADNSSSGHFCKAFMWGQWSGYHRRRQAEARKRPDHCFVTKDTDEIEDVHSHQEHWSNVVFAPCMSGKDCPGKSWSTREKREVMKTNCRVFEKICDEQGSTEEMDRRGVVRAFPFVFPKASAKDDMSQSCLCTAVQKFTEGNGPSYVWYNTRYARVENCFEKRDPAWRYKYMQDATYQKEIHFHASYRLMLELCIEITCAPISAIHEAVQELERAVVCPFLKLEET